jgi:Fe-S cluster biogenesis protein NfuA
MKKSIKDRVEEILVQIRPHLQEDGGDVEFYAYEEDTQVLELRFLGSCSVCPLSIMTLRAGIERFILKQIPEVRRVEEKK